MKYIVNSAEMKKADQTTSEYFGLDSMLLMERAALCVVRHIEERFPKKVPVLVLAGPGGNGGDGVAIGRILYLRDYPVQILLTKPADKCSAICQKQITIAQKYQVPFTKSFDEQAVVIVDAMLGIGLNRELQEHMRNLVLKVNQTKSYVVSVDVPTGINADNGKIMGDAIKAQETVTFGFEKLGLYLYPAAKYCGKISVEEIGITKESFLGELPTSYLLEDQDLKHVLQRPTDGNKGTFGKIFIIAGSQKMAGAAVFAAKSALRMGCGMVKILTHSLNRDLILQMLPEAMLSFYEGKETQEEIEQLIEEGLSWGSVCLIGPGLSTESIADKIVVTLSKLLVKKEDCENKLSPHTVIYDADAINILAKETVLKDKLFNLQHTNVVFTPHMMELSRLSGIPKETLQSDFLDSVKDFAKDKTAIFVCKDARSITIRNNHFWVNPTGCHALATAGSGDCLAGILSGVFAQKKLSMKPGMHEDTDLFLAALSVYFHGRLGEKAGQSTHSASVIASDLTEEISNLITEFTFFDEK